MLQQNCRVEKFNGFRYYEKDIIYDDYIFTHDIQLTIDATYVTPGFGIALMDNEGFSIREKGSTYLFKVGYKEASIYYTDSIETTLVKQITCPHAVTIQDHMIFTFTKKGKKITILLNGELIFEEYIKRELDKYNIGYYSNAGNIINSISMAASIPDNWVVNMKNTQGGYIRFLSNSFELTQCKNNAEIEQQKIELKAGTYFLKCKLEDIDEINDLKYFIHKYDDDRLFDDEKNILNSYNSFTLLEDTYVNLKFVGKQGKVADIIISLNKEDDYIPTSNDVINFEGSSIDVFLHDLKKITWKGMVSRTPKEEYNKDIIFGLILDNRTKVKPSDAKIILGTDIDKHLYDYEFNTDGYVFNIYKDEEKIYSKKLTNLSNKITIFKNITAIITQMILYKKNGDIIDVNVQDENKKYINANINSPIIVVDQYEAPLKLSSSYRVSHYDNNKKYIFSNWEREYFYPEKFINLTNKVLNQDDTVIIYGIYKNEFIDLNKIYDIPADNINSIDLMTKGYDYIPESKALFIDKIQNTIYLSPDQIKKYQMIVVDYLKTESYCINYHYDKDAYEVNISSLQNNNKILYNTSIVTGSENKVTQINDYKITNINGNVNGYVVMQRGGL